MSYLGTKNFDHSTQPTIGILLVNLGTPDEPTTAAVRRYLKEFLSDPRVIEVPKVIWWLVLNLVILNIRPPKSAKLYQSIWLKEGSPLMHYSQSLTQNLEQQLRADLTEDTSGAVLVRCAMRYGNPSIFDTLEEMRKKNLKHLYVLPLYPQYSATTSASIFDAVSQALQSWRYLPELHFLQSYHDAPNFIDLCCEHLEDYWKTHDKAEKLFLSYHGLPLRYLHNGDPYHCQCHKTTRLISEKLDLKPDFIQTVFQSRFGREAWLQPYFDKTLEASAKAGVKSVQVFCPGFSVDCLETLEEIAIQGKEEFEAAGGESFQYIPALNDSEDHANFLKRLIMKHVSPWVEQLPSQPTLDLQKKHAEAITHNQKNSTN